jgi:hypothetical protein
MLAITRRGHYPSLCLLDTSRLPVVSMIREYDLPSTWESCTVAFSHDTSPSCDFAYASGALFYAAPENRIVMIVARKTTDGLNSLVNWLFVRELDLTYLQKDMSRVPWTWWSQLCLIKDKSLTPAVIQGPYVVGNRALYLESRAYTGGTEQTLHTIDFSGSASSTLCSEGWVWKGGKGRLVPSEYCRSIPDSVRRGLSIEDIRATEDNIILFSVRLASINLEFAKVLAQEPHKAVRQVVVLTFGSHSSKRSMHRNGK